MILALGEIMTPLCFWPMESGRMRLSFMSFFPEQRLGSQWPRSQHAALKEGREVGVSSSKLEGLGPRGRGALVYFLPRVEKLSFLWRTMLVVVLWFCEFVVVSLLW